MLCNRSPQIIQLVSPLFWFTLLITMSQRAAVQVLASSSKRISIIRHGQAMHNPRAEVARDNGCSMDEFINLMREDDVLDAPLTDLGKEQARNVNLSPQSKIDLVVSSPLSRALQTADFVCPPSALAKRVCCEHFREVNGDMLNAKRRNRSELEKLFSSWDFNQLESEEDSMWTPKMEEYEDVAERGYQGLYWLMRRPEDSIVLVCHGGILRYMMNLHDLILMEDQRTKPGKPLDSRFDNCEVRHYLLKWNDGGDSKEQSGRRRISMTEIDE